MKRLFDILFSFLILIILSPFFIVIAVLIKLDSKGKIFFRQKRVGKNSREFSLLKFRTMREDSERSGMLTVGERDSRITRTGFYLRKYKLDELPQLVNVLKGDMSMVGPRPEVKKYVDLYTAAQRDVLSVKPGITDVASLQYSDENEMLSRYSNPDEAYVKEIMPAKLALSLNYLEKRTLFSDMRIIGKTATKIFYSSPQQFEIFLLSLLVFSLPLYERASAWLAGAVVVLRLFNRKIFSDVKHAAGNIITVLFLAYYLVHVAGTFYSTNLSYAFFDLQVKLPFLLFPLLLTAPLQQPLAVTRLKKFFIAGCTVAALLCLVAAIISFSRTHRVFDFFYSDYSLFLHVTYFSMYLNLCILFLIDELTDKNKRQYKFNLLLLIFLFFNVILLNARTALFACFITALFYSVIASIQRGVLRHTYKIIVLLVIIVAGAGIYSNIIYNRFVRFSELLKNMRTEIKPQSDDSYNSVSIRVELWKDSWELIRKNALFGVGTGDIKDVLKEKYTENKFYYGAEKKFNPHNQFLHTTLALGLTGLAILLLMLALPSLRALRDKNYLFVFFIAVIGINCITESIIEVQKGVLLFCIFSLLLFYSKQEPVTG